MRLIPVNSEKIPNEIESANFIHTPPLFNDLLFEDVYANPVVATVLSNILGPDPELRYVGTNSVPLFTASYN